MEIRAMRLGVANAYLLKDRHWIIIDGGAPKKSQSIKKYLDLYNIDSQDIKIIILTHGHYDHVGNAAYIKEITGAPVAVHRDEAEWCRKALQPLSPGYNLWGIIFSFLLKLSLPFNKFKNFEPDIILEDKPFSLKKYGVDATVYPTPGHSRGSVSIVTEEGRAFVGDLAMNGLPLRINAGKTLFVDDHSQLLQSYRFLREKKVTRIYPAHGKPFPFEKLMRYID